MFYNHITTSIFYPIINRMYMHHPSWNFVICKLWLSVSKLRNTLLTHIPHNIMHYFYVFMVRKCIITIMTLIHNTIMIRLFMFLLPASLSCLIIPLQTVIFYKIMHIFYMLGKIISCNTFLDVLLTNIPQTIMDSFLCVWRLHFEKTQTHPADIHTAYHMNRVRVFLRVSSCICKICWLVYMDNL